MIPFELWIQLCLKLNLPLGLSALRANEFLLCLSHFELGFLSLATDWKSINWNTWTRDFTFTNSSVGIFTLHRCLLSLDCVSLPWKTDDFWVHWKGLLSELGGLRTWPGYKPTNERPCPSDHFWPWVRTRWSPGMVAYLLTNMLPWTSFFHDESKKITGARLHIIHSFIHSDVL